MLSDFASYLWSFLVGIFNSVLSWFQVVFGGLFSLLGDIYTGMVNFLANLAQNFLNGLGKLLKDLFQPIYEFFAAIFHLVSKLVEFLGLLLQVFLQLGHIIIAFIEGLFNTLSGLSYDGSTPQLDSNMSQAVDAVSSTMQTLQLDNLAYVLLFMIWIFTAVSVVKMIGSMRNI